MSVECASVTSYKSILIAKYGQDIVFGFKSYVVKSWSGMISGGEDISSSPKY